MLVGLGRLGSSGQAKWRPNAVVVGDYFVDILVDEKFIIEVKATELDNPVYKAQLINYLKASGLPLGFLLNFGKEFFDFERVVFT